MPAYIIARVQADLPGAVLLHANLDRVALSGANFAGVALLGTVIVNTDLSEVKGLESVIHHTRSLSHYGSPPKRPGRASALDALQDINEPVIEPSAGA